MCYPDLECSTIVLRGVLRKPNFDRQKNQLLAAEFMLRMKNGAKEAALSVGINISIDDFEQQFNPCHAVATLHVGRIRDVEGANLDVVQDQPRHAGIVGVPHAEDDPGMAEYVASRLLEQARLVRPNR